MGGEEGARPSKWTLAKHFQPVHLSFLHRCTMRSDAHNERQKPVSCSTMDAEPVLGVEWSDDWGQRIFDSEKDMVEGLVARIHWVGP